MSIPTYIFTGLLEGGKTSFMKDVLSDENFTQKEKTLIVQLEYGIEEFDKDFLKKYNCCLVEFDEEQDVTISALKNIAKEKKPDRIMIELNGMWELADFVDKKLPSDWEVFQIVACINGNTFKLYSANLGQRMFEHITNADLIVFNRCTQEDKDYLHEKNIRAMNPRATIFLDDIEGNSEDYRDNMFMPFDLTKDKIDIIDEDFGLFYVDSSSEPMKYDGKIISFKARVLKSNKLPKDWLIVGRHAMVCCADDIEFIGFACKSVSQNVENKQWYNITAKVNIEHLEQYRGEGPVLTIMEINRAEPPKEDIVYFN